MSTEWLDSFFGEENRKKQRESAERDQELLRAAKIRDLRPQIWAKLLDECKIIIEEFNSHLADINDHLKFQAANDCMLKVFGNSEWSSLTIQLFESGALRYWRSASPHTTQKLLTIHMNQQFEWHARYDGKKIEPDRVSKAILGDFLQEYYRKNS